MHCRPIRLLALAAAATAMVTSCSSTGPGNSSPAKDTPAAGSAAVGSSGGPSAVAVASNGKITIDTTDQLMFAPSMITTGVGALTVTLTDNGSYPHNLSVPALHVTSHTVGGAPGSTSTTVTLHFTKPGRYPFECTFHASAGMRGEFLVKR